MKLFPSLQKKTEAYEEKKEERNLFHPDPNPFTKISPFPESPEIMHRKGKSKIRRLDITKFALPKCKEASKLVGSVAFYQVHGDQHHHHN